MSMFSESSDISSMRVLSFLSLVMGGIIATVGMYKQVELSGLSMLTGVFVGSAFGGKVMQKFAEVKEAAGK